MYTFLTTTGQVYYDILLLYGPGLCIGAPEGGRWASRHLFPSTWLGQPPGLPPAQLGWVVVLGLSIFCPKNDDFGLKNEEFLGISVIFLEILGNPWRFLSLTFPKLA